MWAKNLEKMPDSPVRHVQTAAFLPFASAIKTPSLNLNLPGKKVVVVEEVGWEGTQETEVRILSSARLSKASVHFGSSVNSLPSSDEAESIEKIKNSLRVLKLKPRSALKK